MTDKIDFKNYPFWLQQHIGEEHDSIGRSNQCEHRPTYQEQLDRCTVHCIKLYDNGVAWRAKQSVEDLQQCQQLYPIISGDDRSYPWYVEATIGKGPGSRMLIERTLRLFDRYLKIKEVFK